MDNIYLTGFMGSGKTTLGEKLAQELSMKWVDLDEFIEFEMEMSCYDIVEKFGIEYFRKIEKQKLAYLADCSNTVLSLGGGTLIHFQNQKIVLRKGLLVYLRWSPEQIIHNIQSSKKRPLLKEVSLENIDQLLLERAEGYAQAHIVIDCEKKEPDSVLKELIREVQHAL